MKLNIIFLQNNCSMQQNSLNKLTVITDRQADKVICRGGSAPRNRSLQVMNENIFVVLLNYNNILALSSGWREIKAILIKLKNTKCKNISITNYFITPSLLPHPQHWAASYCPLDFLKYSVRHYVSCQVRTFEYARQSRELTASRPSTSGAQLMTFSWRWRPVAVE